MTSNNLTKVESVRELKNEKKKIRLPNNTFFVAFRSYTFALQILKHCMAYIRKNNDNLEEGNGDSNIMVLIKKAHGGDEKAFRQIYEMHSGKMYSLCKRYSGVSADADDLFQEGYIKVYNNLGAYKGLGSFEGWVRRIFINTCLDYLKRKRNLVFTDKIELKQDLHPYIDAENAIKLSNEELLKIIQKMPDGYRTIVNLYLIEGYNHREIGEMLQINEGTSKSQLSKAKNKLQEIITKQNGG